MPEENATSAKGTLFLVGTPLGNLEDLTIRASNLLKKIGWVACEDTRVTRRLLSHLGSHARVFSLRRHNERRALEKVLRHLREGEDVAYCTDAGLPAISDPGTFLVDGVRAEGFAVVPLPGPTAPSTAVSWSGLEARRWVFLGFLPKLAREREALLKRFGELNATLVLFESPHRVRDLLLEIAEYLPNRRVADCREMTKQNEECLVGFPEELLPRVRARGEHVIVVEPDIGKERRKSEGRLSLDLLETLRKMARFHRNRKARDVARMAAEILGIPANEAYGIILEERGERE
ncbi:MAG: 16S rRNA (cytidine(1402)-2'-O)-methyltransferase [Candidatus Hydrogenedentota bacterium]|nr:MAG: 16S rRNA (cytidine(1402)-2'-O)-methyltransferase [Candidatus Hydrogenedentota bacterium]